MGINVHRTFLLGGRALLQISTVAITNWFGATKYPFFSRQWIFFLFKQIYFSLSPTRQLPGIDYDKHCRCLIRNRNCLLFVSIWVRFRLCDGVRLPYLYYVFVLYFSFCLSSFCIFVGCVSLLSLPFSLTFRYTTLHGHFHLRVYISHQLNQ